MKQLNQAQTLAINGAVCNNQWAPVGIPGIIVGLGIGYAPLPFPLTLSLLSLSITGAMFMVTVTSEDCAYSVANFFMPMGTAAIGMSLIRALK